jgi:hypothetical protein
VIRCGAAEFGKFFNAATSDCAQCATAAASNVGKDLNNARFAQSRDLTVIVAELPEHAIGILPHLVRRVLD